MSDEIKQGLELWMYCINMTIPDLDTSLFVKLRSLYLLRRGQASSGLVVRLRQQLMLKLLF